ncbi:MAG: cell wall-binding repeat-containing protein [Mobilicoccus sp.]|nr:cell wall-binding repeat-containing protein [Mobilicoccus sp.]
MYRIRRTLTAVVTAGLVSVTLAPPAEAAGVDRTGGTDRIDTALKLYEQHRQVYVSDTVVLTRADDYADALAATPLAALLDAPILTTLPNRLDPRVLAALNRQGVKEVVIVGGERAVSPAIGQALADAGFEVTQFSGDSRFTTALAVAEVVMEARQATSVPVYVATGTNFADALAAGAAASQAGGVVALSMGPLLDPETARFVSSSQASSVTAVGGPAARAVTTARVRATTISGDDRFDTAAKLAAHINPSPTHAVLASGETFADSLAGGPFAALVGAPMLLTPSRTLAPQTAAYLRTPKPRIMVLGGDKAVSQTVSRAVATLVGP